MQIFLVYDKIIKDTPIKNTERTHRCHFKDRLSVHNIQCQIISSDRIGSAIRPDSILLYPIEFSSTDFTIYERKIPNSTKSLLIKHRIPVLGLDFHDVNFFHNYHYIKNYQCQQGIDTYLISSNVKYVSDVSLQPYLTRFKKVYTVNYWEHTLRVMYPYTGHYYGKVSLESIDIRKKHLDFLSFNRNLKPHRLALVSEFLRLNLFDNCDYSSILLKGESNYFDDEIIRQAKSIVDPDGQQHLLDFIKNFSPRYTNYENPEMVGPFLNEIDPYRYTFFSLITETEIHSNILFVSEKIFKAMNFYHPFIVFGSPGILNWLRTQGYETFPELFNEAYDDEPDPKKKLNLIINQIVKFKSLTAEEKHQKISSLIPKLQYNYDVFWNKPNVFKHEIKKIFLDIYENQCLAKTR